MINNKTWTLVANRTGAKLFETSVDHMTFESPTQFTCGKGKIRGVETTEHDNISRKFAQTLAAMLKKAESAHHYEKLVLVSEPLFLKVLKTALSPQVIGRVVTTLGIDIKEMPDHKLSQNLSALLFKA